MPYIAIQYSCWLLNCVSSLQLLVTQLYLFSTVADRYQPCQFCTVSGHWTI